MIINFIGFYIVWWCCALLSAGKLWPINYLVSFIFIAIHFKKISTNSKKDITVLILLFLIGTTSDLIFSYFNILKLSNNSYVWLIPIWACFPLTLNYSLKRFLQLPVYLIFPLSAVFGTSSYYFAAKFNLLIYPNEFYKIFIHASWWGILMLVFSVLNKESKK